MKEFVELPVEKEVSNPKIYRFVPNEPIEKRTYRQERAKKDVDARMKALSKYTGGDFRFDGKNRENVQNVTLLRMFEKIGFWTEHDFSDMFFICADESVRNLEKHKETIKDDMDRVKAAKLNQRGMGPGPIQSIKKKEIFVPSGVRIDGKIKA